MSQSKLINEIQKKDTHTENGMVAHSTSSNACVDLFFQIGAMRNWDKQHKQNAFIKAYYENPEVALKILFYSRDIRGGQGERQTFRDIFNFVPNNYKYTHHIPEYGRWDDLLYTFGDEDIIKGLREGNQLCAKWMPRQGPIAKRLANKMGLSARNWRKLLVSLTNVVEQKMCANQWKDINYSHTPSQAARIYRNAFKRHDEDGYTAYLKNVEEGKQKINAGALAPHDLVRAYLAWNSNQDQTIEAQWKALPNYITGTNKLLPICDVSGSMTGTPMEVSIALGIYISERNEGVFKDAFITFSSKPTLEVLKGNLFQRVSQLSKADWEMSTNLEAVFALVLKKAKKAALKEEDMPETLLILSDMQFDMCVNTDKTAMDMIKKQYKDAGYKLPRIVFWNLRAVDKSFPVQNKDGVAMVSGFSPSIMKNILQGKDFSPEGIMLDTVMSERYAPITL